MFQPKSQPFGVYSSCYFFKLACRYQWVLQIINISGAERKSSKLLMLFVPTVTWYGCMPRSHFGDFISEELELDINSTRFAMKGEQLVPIGSPKVCNIILSPTLTNSLSRRNLIQFLSRSAETIFVLAVSCWAVIFCRSQLSLPLNLTTMTFLLPLFAPPWCFLYSKTIST